MSDPVPSQRKTQPRITAERAILDAAEEVFAEAGFGGASMQQIADRAGVPKANVHYYFSTKKILYRQVVERVLRIWLSAADSFGEAATPTEALTDYISVKMDLSRSHRAGSKVWATEILQGAPAIQDYLDTTLRDWLATREPIIRNWIATGQMRPIEPKNLLYIIWATTQHFADFSHQIETLNDGKPMDDTDWQAAKDDVTNVILSGLIPPN